MRRTIAIVAALIAGISVLNCGGNKTAPVSATNSPAITSANTKAEALLKQFERNTWNRTHTPETATDFETGQGRSIHVQGHANKAGANKRTPLYSPAEIAASERRDAAKEKRETTNEKPHRATKN